MFDSLDGYIGSYKMYLMDCYRICDCNEFVF